MATPAPTPRASFLAGLRTGGVRSASGPIPHTAAPSGTFNIPRIITPNQEDNFYPPEEEDELSNMMNQNMYIQNGRTRQAPLTAAVDGIPNRFLQQQQQQQQQQQSMNMNGSMNFNPLMSPAMAQNQLQQVQLQLMQMELARMQVRASFTTVRSTWMLIYRLYRLSSTRLSCSLRRRRRLSSAGASPSRTTGALLPMWCPPPPAL